MIRTKVVWDVLVPGGFDLFKSFITTIHHKNIFRTHLYRLFQTARVNNVDQSLSEEPLIELMVLYDYCYKSIITPPSTTTSTTTTPNAYTTSAEIQTAAIYQRCELLLTVLHGASNFAFATPYGPSEQAWAHYYPIIDHETGEETVPDDLLDRDVPNDGPWNDWQDLRTSNILKMNTGLFDNNGYPTHNVALNAEYPLLRVVGKIKGRYSTQCETWVEELRQQVDKDELISMKLLLDTKKKKNHGGSWNDNDDGNDDEDENNNNTNVIDPIPLILQTSGFMVQFAIEQFIDMLLLSENNPILEQTLSTMNFNKARCRLDPTLSTTTTTTPTNTSTTTTTSPFPTPSSTLIQVTSANSHEILGNPFPLGSKMMVHQRHSRFGFYYTPSNPLMNECSNGGFHPDALFPPQSKRGHHGLCVYSHDEQLAKLNGLARGLGLAAQQPQHDQPLHHIHSPPTTQTTEQNGTYNILFLEYLFKLLHHFLNLWSGND